MQLANQEAQRFNHEYIGTEHLLLGLIKENEGIAAQVLLNLGVKLEDVREEVLEFLGADSGEDEEEEAQGGEPYLAQLLAHTRGPIVAASDYVRALPEMVRAYLPEGRRCATLGTDGFGRSDFRSKLREHFEVNRHYIVVAALKALSEEGKVPVAQVAEAIKKYGIKVDKINPLYA